MARVPAITALAAGVRTFFEANGVTANVSVGWKAPTKRINEGPGGANRVVFIPTDPSGRAGRFTIGTSTHHTPKPIATWEQNIVVAVWAVDASTSQALADDEKQFTAVNNLLEDTMEAIRAVAHAAAIPGEVNFMLEPLELAYGREARVSYVLKSELFARDYATRTPGAQITTHFG